MQLSLRLKAMKRQVEEAEEEIDRLESSKKKLQRELEEQMDVNEQLQGQLNSMKKDLRWASAATPQRAARCFQGILGPCRKPVLPVASRDESGSVHFSHSVCSVGSHVCHLHISASASAGHIFSLCL